MIIPKIAYFGYFCKNEVFIAMKKALRKWMQCLLKAQQVFKDSVRFPLAKGQRHLPYIPLDARRKHSSSTKPWTD